MVAPREPKTQGWLPYAGLLLTLAGMIYQGGILASEVRQNTARIVKLEAVDAAREVRLAEMERREARIDAQLEFLVQQAKNNK